MGEIIVHPILLNFHLKLGIRIKLARVLLKNIFPTFIVKHLRVSNKNRTFVLKKQKNEKVFQILVPDDKLVSRIISCENLVTELFVIDRADKDFVSEWEKELKKPALYILINRDTKELYVGETDNSYKRLKNHEAKDFWTEAIVFHSTTSTLSTTEVKWLEAKTFEELKMLDSYKLSHNKQTPKFPKLKKNQIYTLMPVFEEAKNYICAAGFDIFLRNVKGILMKRRLLKTTMCNLQYVKMIVV